MPTENKPMTKERIKKYASLKREIAMLEQQIYVVGETDPVIDYANDYRSGKAKPIVIKGYGSRRIPRLSRRVTACYAECEAIEHYIDSVDNSTIRQILTRRYIEGKTMRETAAIVGYSESRVRAFLAGHFQSQSLLSANNRF